MLNSDFPILAFIIAFVVVMLFCLGISLFIMRNLSDDPQKNILRQVWETYFSASSSHNTPHQTPNLPPTSPPMPPSDESEGN